MREKRRTRRSRDSQILVKMCEEKTDEAYYVDFSISRGLLLKCSDQGWVGG